MAATKQKGSYFAFLVYEDSAPSGWRDLLKASHLSFAISPLHEPDEEVKKPHWHVVYFHGSPCTVECALRAIPEGVPANGHLEILHAPRNYQRYLIHLDDNDKQQFDEGAKAIDVLNCFPLDLSRDYSAAERAAQRARIWELIRVGGFTEYWDLLDYLYDNDLELFDYAAQHTILFNTALTSRRNGALGD